MSSTPRDSSAPGKGAWLALTAALLGWLFDGAEMGVFSLVGRPAILDLMGRQASFVAMAKSDQEKHVAVWLGVITALFLVGAATGGVLFGWLGDRIGRVRAMTMSVLTYAVFTSLCGFVSKPVNLGIFELEAPFQLGLLRFIASLGMGGEWSLGVSAGNGSLAQSITSIHGWLDWCRGECRILNGQSGQPRDRQVHFVRP